MHSEEELKYWSTANSIPVHIKLIGMHQIILAEFTSILFQQAAIEKQNDWFWLNNEVISYVKAGVKTCLFSAPLCKLLYLNPELHTYSCLYYYDFYTISSLKKPQKLPFFEVFTGLPGFYRLI